MAWGKYLNNESIVCMYVKKTENNNKKFVRQNLITLNMFDHDSIRAVQILDKEISREWCYEGSEILSVVPLSLNLDLFSSVFYWPNYLQ